MVRFVDSASDKPSICYFWNYKTSLINKIVKKNDNNKSMPTLSLNDVKFPVDGGLHDIKAVFPLRTDTDKFEGGSGARMLEILLIMIKMSSRKFIILLPVVIETVHANKL